MNSEGTIKTRFQIGSHQVAMQQPTEGYRFNIESVLLAFFVDLPLGQKDKFRLLDMGCGSGILPLLLRGRYPDLGPILAVDFNGDHIVWARENLNLNPWIAKQKILFLAHDWRDELPTNETLFPAPSPTNSSARFHFIVSNPPWYKVPAGRLNSDPNQATSRHELQGDFQDWLFSVRRNLLSYGKVFLVFVADRLSEVMEQFAPFGLQIKRLQFIHAKWNTPAKTVLIEAQKDGKQGLRIEAPMVVHLPDGRFNPQIQSIIQAPPG